MTVNTVMFFNSISANHFWKTKFLGPSIFSLFNLFVHFSFICDDPSKKYPTGFFRCHAVPLHLIQTVGWVILWVRTHGSCTLQVKDCVRHVRAAPLSVGKNASKSRSDGWDIGLKAFYTFLLLWNHPEIDYFWFRMKWRHSLPKEGRSRRWRQRIFAESTTCLWMLQIWQK